jgi:hypothetical protein
MAIKAGRGLYRLWRVFSLLWVLIIGLVTYGNLPSRGLTDQEVGLPPPLPGFVLEQPDNGRWQAIQTGAAVAVGPPAFILLVGAALVWAFRGFR